MESVLVVEVRFDSPLDTRAVTPLANYPPARCTSGRRRRREAMLPMQQSESKMMVRWGCTKDRAEVPGRQSHVMITVPTNIQMMESMI